METDQEKSYDPADYYGGVENELYRYLYRNADLRN